MKWIPVSEALPAVSRNRHSGQQIQATNMAV